MLRLLIVEDEAAIADTLVFALQAEGFATHRLQRGGEALEYLKTQVVDLVILDVGLPDISGFEVCKQIRTVSTVPILFLTARSSEVDRVVGLEIGADDYVVKPFSPREVAVRARVILKRAALPGSASASTLLSGALFSVDEERRQIHFRGQPLSLTRQEYLLLTQLLSQPRRVFSRELLLSAAGIAADAGYERNVDSHIKSLRAKLRRVAATAEPIQTHRGFGYSYDPDQS